MSADGDQSSASAKRRARRIKKSKEAIEKKGAIDVAGPTEGEIDFEEPLELRKGEQATESSLKPPSKGAPSTGVSNPVASSRENKKNIAQSSISNREGERSRKEVDEAAAENYNNCADAARKKKIKRVTEEVGEVDERAEHPLEKRQKTTETNKIDKRASSSKGGGQPMKDIHINSAGQSALKNLIGGGAGQPKARLSQKKRMQLRLAAKVAAAAVATQQNNEHGENGEEGKGADVVEMSATAKRRERRKQKKQKEEAQKAQQEEEAVAAVVAAATKNQGVKTRDNSTKQSSGAAPAPETESKRRYIVFVGNLPYRMPQDQIKKLFSNERTKVKSVRLITDKKNKKPKGFAFVELEDSISLHYALQLHHHELEGRPINVELSAGGGGNSANRKEKLAKARSRLAEERKEKMLRTQENEKKVKAVEAAAIA